MVRKAITLESLNGLNISTTTRSYLEKNFKSTGDVIHHGRCIAYDNPQKISKWESELVSAVREAGFVRPNSDFEMSFRVGTLYADIYAEYVGEIFVTRVSDLSNEQYESFIGITNEDIENLKLTLHNQLSEREYEVICRRYGLDGGDDENRDYEPIAQYFGVTAGRIYQNDTKARRSLKHYGTLPALFDAPSELNDTIGELRSKLDELHETLGGEYKALMESEYPGLYLRLYYIGNWSLRYPSKVKKQLDLRGLNDCRDVRYLNISIGVYRCLRRARIYRISDIVNFPKDEWRQNRHIFKRRHFEEIVEKMRLAGYEDFNINI